MKHTDTDKPTASAPETRKDVDQQWEEWLGGDGSADTIIPAEKPTAQHSPVVDVESVLKVATALQKVAELPSESNRDKLTATLTESRQKLLELRERDAREYATLKAQAAQLAEALRDIRDCAFNPWQVAGVDKSDTTALSAFASRVHSVAKAALAAYEEGK